MVSFPETYTDPRVYCLLPYHRTYFILTNQVDNQAIIPSTGVIQLTLTLKMTTAQVVERQSLSTAVNSPIQD